MKNRKLFIISSLLMLGTVFASSFGIAYALQVNNPSDVKFSIGTSFEELTTKVYYQSSFFYGGDAKVYAYAWDSTGTNGDNASYPGVEMTAEDYKHGLYSYEVSEKFDKIIFNAGNVDSDPTKTGDLTIDRSNVYYSQHENAWNTTLDDCSFSYYMVGKMNGIEDWSTLAYENGLLKNYAGNNIGEYLKADYTFKKDDSFKVRDTGTNWYGVGGSTQGGNYDVKMANSIERNVFVYFTPGSNLYSGVDFYYHRDNGGYGSNFWCHSWISATDTTTWPGTKMTMVNQSYWYSANVCIRYSNIIFNNKGSGGSGNLETATLANIDCGKPYYDGGTWKSSMN